MLSNYWKIALRTLRRSAGYSAINVAGLAIGVACCLFILLFVRDELRYDRFHEHADRIYRTLADDEGIAISPPIVAPLLVRTFPEVETAARVMKGTAVVQRGAHLFQENRFYYGDSSFFDVFSFRLLAGDPDEANHLLVRIAPGDVSGTLAHLEAQWALLAPHRPFTYRFLDDTFDALYREEQKMGRVFGLFAALAVLVACLGLFGLATFSAERRAKEIGIRKVLGASVSQIVFLLSRDFTRLVAMGFLVAAPIAYLVMSGWLEQFAYRIDIRWLELGAVGLIALAAALVTVGYQALKASTADPVETLRYE